MSGVKRYRTILIRVLNRRNQNTLLVLFFSLNHDKHLINEVSRQPGIFFFGESGFFLSTSCSIHTRVYVCTPAFERYRENCIFDAPTFVKTCERAKTGARFLGKNLLADEKKKK